MPEEKTALTVVMITHNRVDEVLRSLGHLSRLPEQLPIILVDNGSTDGTVAAVAQAFPQVQVEALGSNLGAAGRSVGVRLAGTRHVAFCDDDTWWEPGSLGAAAKLLDDHPRLAILTGRILVGPEEREDPICEQLLRSPLPPEPGLPGYPLLGFLAGASVVRRAAFLEAGGFDARFCIGGEEELLALDLAARGWFLQYVPELVVHHHPSPRRDVPSRRSQLLRNALWSAWLRRPLRSALRETWRLIRQARRDGILLPGLVDALAGLPWVLRERRVIPVHVEERLRLLDAARGAC